MSSTTPAVRAQHTSSHWPACPLLLLFSHFASIQSSLFVESPALPAAKSARSPVLPAAKFPPAVISVHFSCSLSVFIPYTHLADLIHLHRTHHGIQTSRKRRLSRCRRSLRRKASPALLQLGSPQGCQTCCSPGSVRPQGCIRCRSSPVLSCLAPAESYSCHSQQQSRGVKTLDFAGTKETVYERADWPIPKIQEYFKNDTLALIGYGSQG